MLSSHTRGLAAVALILALVQPVLAVEYSPLYAKFFQVAGSGDPGFKDGAFLKAAFKDPGGLALSPDGTTLFVADTGNHAVRAVDLDRQHRVTTLCGNGTPGDLDGRSGNARLSGPTELQLSADGRALFILDRGNRKIRRMDTRTNRLSTVFPPPLAAARPVSPSSFVLDPLENRLYVVDMAQGRLLSEGVEAGASRELGRDEALRCPEGRLVLAGRELVFCSPCDPGRAFKVTLNQAAFPGTAAPAALTPAAFALQALAELRLTPTATGFCALQAGDAPGKLLFWDPGRAALVLANLRDGGQEQYAMTDYEGTLLTGPSADLVGHNATSDWRCLYEKELFILPQPGGGLFFVSEQASNRVSGADPNLLFGNGMDLNAIRGAEKKPPKAIRFLVVGDSLAYYIREYQPEKRPNANRTFVRQLEWHLNLEQALRGMGRRYEVRSRVDQLGNVSGCPTSYLLTQEAALEASQADEVLLVLDYMNIMSEAFAYFTKPLVDDLPVGPADAEVMGMSPEQRLKRAGPLFRGLIDYIRGHPEECKGFMSVSGDEEFHILKPGRAILEHPRFRQFVVDVLEKGLVKDLALARKHHARVSLVLLPTRDLVEVGGQTGEDFFEGIHPALLDAPIAEMAARHGVSCFTLTEPARLLDLSVFPMVAVDDHHYLYRGQGWLAFLLARQILDRH